MITPAEFNQRRQRLMAAMQPNSVAIIAAAPESVRNNDAEYPYRQDSSFWYLTGFPEPEAIAVLVAEEDEGSFILFCRERDKTMEIWNGYRAGPNGAMADYGADEAYPIARIESLLPELLANKSNVYVDLGVRADVDALVHNAIAVLAPRARQGVTSPAKIIRLANTVHEMRLRKSAAELEIMRTAGRISAGAHVRAMRTVEPGMWEYQLEAEYIHEFMRHGARSPAYTSIVGGGANGCILHYVENNQRLKDGDLVLVDAGCEYEHYASDITRTFPVNGTFSKEQQALYELVLAAQQAAIHAAQVGNPYHQGHHTAIRILTEGLRDLGLLVGEVDELIEEQAYTDFYMHGTGHWLGLDVHDVGQYLIDGTSRPLEEGMVLTVEPGIYVAPDNVNVDERWRGLGIRIEDDVVITANGPEVITATVPKTVAEIEALMAGQL